MANEVAFSINVDSPVAVYVQIENQVQFAIASGRLRPGDTLPSVREMSETLDTNANTVTKAYRELELLGLVRTRRGVGVTISDRAPRIARESARAVVQEHLVEAAAEAAACGLGLQEIRAIVTEAVERGIAPYRPKPARK